MILKIKGIDELVISSDFDGIRKASNELHQLIIGNASISDVVKKENELHELVSNYSSFLDGM